MITTKPDDRNVYGGNIYCTQYNSEPCQYEKDAPGRVGCMCTLFNRSLRLGRAIQSLRCKECRAIKEGAQLPAPTEPPARRCDGTEIDYDPERPVNGIIPWPF